MTTPADVWEWFFTTPGASWDDWLTAIEVAEPLTCLRDSSGRFVRDENGVIVVVPLVAVREVKIAA